MNRFINISLVVLILTIAFVCPKKTSLADHSSVSLVINEFMASNTNSVRDPQGEYEDWIEIHNYSDTAIDVGGMYLTDDLSEPTKWQIPTPTVITRVGYLLIWADNDTADTGLHANFKLSAAGEEIGLFDTDGVTLIDSVTFGEQSTDISSGRFPDAGDNWHIFTEPTPDSENTGGFLGQVEAPQFNHTHGFYHSSFYVTIATETSGTEIYYTLDGSSPYDDELNEPTGRYLTRPIHITGTTCLRAVAVKSDYKPSQIVTHTYFFLDDVIIQPQNPPGFPTSGWGHAGPDYEMDPVVVSENIDTIRNDLKAIPTLSLVMDVDDWFGGSRGIYVNQSLDGTERVVSMEFIDPNNGDEFQINCALSMQGGVSGGGTSLNRWKADKLSMRPRFKTITDDGTPTGGPSKLNFKVFPNSPVDIFDTLVLDARLGNTWPYGGGVSYSSRSLRPWTSDRTTYQPDIAQYTRDQFVADIQNALCGYSHHGRHIHLYINGIYWGLYNLHERPDHRFAAAYFGGDADNYDCIKHDRNQIINGSNATFTELLNIVESGLASNERYQLIQQYLDVNNFIDYMIPNYFVGNYDWSHKNWYATHNAVDPNGRWRFHHWDGEHMLEGLYQDVTGLDNPGSPTRIHNRLTENAEYRLLFADHVHHHFFNDGALTVEGATALYQIRLDDVDRAVVAESARWGDNQIDRFAHIRYMRDPHWLLERDWLLGTYFQNRTDIVLNQFKARGWYPDIDAPVFYVNDSYQHGGRIKQDDLISIASAEGTIYYSIDGSDPRFDGIELERTEYTTLVSENADKRVLVPTENIGSDWRESANFIDASWLSCSGSPGGVGYERTSGYEDFISLDIQEQMYARNATCYIRIMFDVEDVTALDFMSLKVRYDDGFIAYINGTEVARRNFEGMPRNNSNASYSNSDVVAVVPESIDISDSLDALYEDRNLLAIHGLNVSTTSSDFLISAELVAGENPEPIALTHSAVVKARILEGNTWSALNKAVYAVGPVAQNLKITEIMYHPFDFDRQDTADVNDPNEEFIELMNTGDEPINLNLVSFTNGIDFTFPDIELEPDEYVVIVEKIGEFESRYDTNINIAGQYSGKLNNTGERIRLQDAIGTTIQDFSYSDNWRSLTDGEGFSLTIIDPANPDPNSWSEKDSWRASAYAYGSTGADDSGIIPNPGAVVINELLANSPGDDPDWIELYNTTEHSIDISGWFLSDNYNNLTKYKIEDDTTIGAGQYIVFYEYEHFGNTTNPSGNHPFALSNNGETVILSSAKDGVITGYRNMEDFGPSQQDVPFGRYYKSSTDNYNFVAMDQNTPGSANSYPKVGPVVINEIMYNPDWPDSGPFTNEQYEYIELHNISGNSVSVRGWKFTDGIDFSFPEDVSVTVPAGGYLIVAREPQAFALRYPSVDVEKIFGPYDGQLSNAGESIELGMPNGNTDDSGEPYYIRFDRVNYSDGSHPENCPGGKVDLWPTEADGDGLSLHRIITDNYGNDPDNWAAMIPSHGE